MTLQKNIYIIKVKRYGIGGEKKALFTPRLPYHLEKYVNMIKDLDLNNFWGIFKLFFQGQIAA